MGRWGIRDLYRFRQRSERDRGNLAADCSGCCRDDGAGIGVPHHGGRRCLIYPAPDITVVLVASPGPSSGSVGRGALLPPGGTINRLASFLAGPPPNAPVPSPPESGPNNSEPRHLR